MPANRHELERYEEEYWPLYRTLLGLFYDNPDTYYREEEILDSVDKPRDIIRVQLWLVRVAGDVDDFQVEVKWVDGEPLYGLASATKRGGPSDSAKRFSTDEDIAAMLRDVSDSLTSPNHS